MPWVRASLHVIRPLPLLSQRESASRAEAVRCGASQAPASDSVTIILVESQPERTGSSAAAARRSTLLSAQVRLCVMSRLFVGVQCGSDRGVVAFPLPAGAGHDAWLGHARGAQPRLRTIRDSVDKTMSELVRLQEEQHDDFA